MVRKKKLTLTVLFLFHKTLKAFRLAYKPKNLEIKAGIGSLDVIDPSNAISNLWTCGTVLSKIKIAI